jgi:hypothetical protein
MSAGQSRRAGGPNVLAIITIASSIGFMVLLGVFVFQVMGERGGASGASGPRLAVDRERIDFGRVVYDKTVRAVFAVKNVGDQPLQIAERQIAVKVVEGC